MALAATAEISESGQEPAGVDRVGKEAVAALAVAVGDREMAAIIC